MNYNMYKQICDLFLLSHGDFGMPFKAIVQAMFITSDRYRIMSNSIISQNIYKMIEKEFLDFVIQYKFNKNNDL